MATNTNPTRRSFLAGIAAATAATALPAHALDVTAPATRNAAEPLDAAERWYDALLERITRAWEPDFRFRRVRPDEDGDYENDREIEPRRFELEKALAAALALDERQAALVVAVSPSLGESDDSAGVVGYAVTALTLDVLARAERFGFFAGPCPEALRFPDLPAPESHFDRDDLDIAEGEMQSAMTMLSLVQNSETLRAAGFEGQRFCLYGPGLSADEEIRKCQERITAAEKRLAEMRASGVHLTAEQKREAHAVRRREIIAAYAARLEAAGVDASWVDRSDAGWAAAMARREA